jgi:folate-binding protein YgfZ
VKFEQETLMPALVPDVFATAAAAIVARDVIEVWGPDSEVYLQGQLSQDVATIPDGGSAWSLLLQPQGKIDAWLRVSRVGDRFLLDLDEGAGEAALRRLQRFLLRTDCSFELGTWSTVSVRGPGSHGLARADFDGALVLADSEWPGIDGVDALGPDVAAPPSLPLAETDDLEALRIVCGVPSMGHELDEDTIPAAAGIVDRSVSFTKGCYTGQELVARIDSRGSKVPRSLALVVSEAALVAGSDVELEGSAVGTVTSAARVGQTGVALAYVKRGTSLPASGFVDGTAVEIVALRV